MTEAVERARPAADGPAGDLERALRLRELGRHREALAEFGRILASHPQSPTALGYSALSHMVLGEFDRGVALARAAVAAAPDAAFTHGTLAQLLHVTGTDAHEAAESAREAIRLKPDDVWGHILLARCLLEIEPALAIEPAEHARRIAPEQAQAHDACGLVYQRLGRTAQARAAYRRALELEPGRGLGHHRLAMMDRNDLDWREALDGFGRALGADPQLKASQLAVGTLIRARIRWSAFTAAFCLWLVLGDLGHGLATRVFTAVLLGAWAALAWRSVDRVRRATGAFARHVARTDRRSRMLFAIAILCIVGTILVGLVPFHLGGHVALAGRLIAAAAMGALMPRMSLQRIRRAAGTLRTRRAPRLR